MPDIHKKVPVRYSALRRDLLGFLFAQSPNPQERAQATYNPDINPDYRYHLLTPNPDFAQGLQQYETKMQQVDEFLRDEQRRNGVSTPPGLLGNWRAVRTRLEGAFRALEIAKASGNRGSIAGHMGTFHGYQRQLMETVRYADNTLRQLPPRLVGVEVKPDRGGSQPDLLLEALLDGQPGQQVREIKNWVTPPSTGQLEKVCKTGSKLLPQLPLDCG